MSQVASANFGPPWTVGKLLSWTREHFVRCGVDQPRLASEILLAHAIGCQKIQLYTQFEAEPAAPVLDRFRELVKRAAKREPIAYLVGQREFFSLAFEVGPGVLVPRPETEHVVELAMEEINAKTPKCRNAEPGGAEGEENAETLKGQKEEKKVETVSVPPSNPACLTPAFHIWDVGCGSGCLGLTLAHLTRSNPLRPRVVLTDVSPLAIEITLHNSKRHKLLEQCAVVQADGLQLPAEHVPIGGFELIVTNPPYIAESEKGTLPPELAYEPQAALFAGSDGLAFYRLLTQAGRFLSPQGVLICEIGAGQADAVRGLFTAAGWSAAPTKHDLAGHLRVLSFRPTAN